MNPLEIVKWMTILLPILREVNDLFSTLTDDVPLSEDSATVVKEISALAQEIINKAAKL